MMNKKMNTVVFILVGTLVNVVLAIVCIGTLLFLIGISAKNQVASLGPFAVIGGILIAMIIYQRLTNWVITKFNMNDKLEPLFTSKHRRKGKKFD